MISRSKISSRKAGVSLLETMVALGVLSLVLAVVLLATGPTSPRLQALAATGAVKQMAQTARLKAISDGAPITIAPKDLCDSADPLTFFPDGTGTGGPVCIAGQRLVLDPLTGLVGVPE